MEKVYKHLGYSPGEEIEKIFERIEIPEGDIEELLWAQHLRAVHSMCTAVNTYQTLVEFTQSNPRSPILEERIEWDNEVSNLVVLINKSLTENILDTFSMLKTVGVDESVIHNGLSEIMEKAGIKDNIFFKSDTAKTLFSFARHIVLHQFRIPNLKVSSLNVSGTVLSNHGEFNPFKAGCYSGLETLMYLKMFTTDYIAMFNRSVMLYEKTPTEAHHLTMRSQVLQTIINQFIVLDFLGYEKDSIVPLIKVVCQ